MEKKPSTHGTWQINSLYQMFTTPQVQKLLGCSRATVYRILKTSNLKRYYVPHHPGAKYVWACDLYKIIRTAAFRKVARNFVVRDERVPKTLETILGLTDIEINAGLSCGIIPNVDGVVPIWYQQAVTGLWVLPLPYKKY